MSFGFRDIAEELRGSPGPQQGDPEVTGSAQVHHLVNFSHFRQAQNEIQANKIASPVAASSPLTQPEQTLQQMNQGPPLPAVDGSTLQKHHSQRLQPNDGPSLLYKGPSESRRVVYFPSVPTLIKNYQQKRIAFPIFDQSPSSIFAPYFPGWKRTAFLVPH
ncbi:hypothetical protein IWW34DRAFT_794977 [Fusarium oxysporum f. sp. albedinis]|nr:hypothetical protein IWW34DRAFT_794977 [Fusarium oxysporum f. sp. albedinis]